MIRGGKAEKVAGSKKHKAYMIDMPPKVKATG
jgi:hypothetical protein